MSTHTTNVVEAPAHVLAMMVAAHGRVDERELRALDDLEAFRQLGVGRQRFVDIARACVRDLGTGLCERSWLSTEDLHYVDALLDAVPDPDQRLMVCRFGAAAIAADGGVTDDERLVYDHVRAHWRIRSDQLPQAMLVDQHH